MARWDRANYLKLLNNNHKNTLILTLYLTFRSLKKYFWNSPPGAETENNPYNLCYLKTITFYLTYMHYLYILIHMRTTLNIDDKILEKASRLTGVKEKTSLVRLGLEALIAHESSKRLAKLGGTEGNLRSIPRRRSA